MKYLATSLGRKSLFTASLTCLAALPIWAQDEEISVLDTFIAEETALESSDSLMPTDRTVGSVMFDDMTLLEIPRSVLVLSPETLDQFQIKDFSDLANIGAGTSQVNFYGVPGTPAIRGWKGGVYFNGVMRAWQRNEMPTSFGAMEAMEVVKGIAPAQFVTSMVGGYVNMIPKSPFFDEARGEATVKVGSYSTFNQQIDYGSPVLLFNETPAAYRISVTNNQSDKYYDRIGNDYTSIYAAMKVRASDNLRFYFGGEYYNYSSNENAGWNRPSQNLIDNGQYVIGEPLSLVRAGNGGVADRNLIDQTVWGYGALGGDADKAAAFRALVVPDSYVTQALASGTLTQAQVNLMKNLSDAAVRADLYSGLPEDIAQTTSGYLYTPAYFMAGGTVFTESIEGNQVLSDASDYADSTDFIFFADTEFTGSDDFKITNKFFIEKLDTDKLSSYGYAFRSEQFVMNNRLEIDQKFEASSGFGIDLKYGAEVRFTDATQLQDFWVEPMARRDISMSDVSSNSVILAGAQTDPTLGNNNYWGGGFGAGGPGGHAVESELSQFGAFLTGMFTLGENFNIIASGRYEIADWDTKVPDGPTDIAPASASGDTDYFNWSINPNVKLGDKASIYGVYQQATTYAPLQGGAIIGEENFGDSELVEFGLKTSLMDDKLFATAAWYQWEQSAVNNISATSEQFEADGIELEMTWLATDDFTLIASYGIQEVRKVSPLGFRTMPYGLVDPTGANNPEIGLALESGSLLQQFAGAFGGFTPEGGSPSNNPDLVMPGIPENTFKIYGVYDLPGGFSVGAGFVYSDSYWHNYDQTLKIDSSVVVNANVGWKNERWDVLLSLENLTGEDYFYGADPEFAANNLLTKAPDEIQANLTVAYKF